MKDLVNILVLVSICVLVLLLFNARIFVRSRMKIDTENIVVKNVKGICLVLIIILLFVFKYLN